MTLSTKIYELSKNYNKLLELYTVKITFTTFLVHQKIQLLNLTLK